MPRKSSAGRPGTRKSTRTNSKASKSKSGKRRNPKNPSDSRSRHSGGTRASSSSSKSGDQKRPAKKQRVAPTRKSSEIRLQKILASAGFGSRRSCEELIEQGRVEVDKVIVTRLGVTADPDKQKISVDGEFIRFQKKRYFAVNKPLGVISTNQDPTGRARVIDLIDSRQRVYTVGRLDKSSEGLILVTNDGELANQLTHPSFGVEKVYHVNVAGTPTPDSLRALREGVHLAEGFARVQRIRFRKRMKNFSELEMVLDEGRNREIRRLLAKIGHKVLKLKRVAIGPLKLGQLPSAAHRELTRDEIRALQRSTGKKRGEKESSTKTNFRRMESEESRTSSSRSASSRQAGGRKGVGRTDSTGTGKSGKKKASGSFSGERRKKSNKKAGDSGARAYKKAGSGNKKKAVTRSKKSASRKPRGRS